MLLDNSALLEGGQYLFYGDSLFRKDKNPDVYLSRFENLIEITFAAIGSDKIKIMTNKANWDDQGVSSLLENTYFKEIYEDISSEFGDQEESQIITCVRKDLVDLSDKIIEYDLAISSGDKTIPKPNGEKISFQESNINSILSSELDTYLKPEKVDHYWKNIGLGNATDEEKGEAYDKISNLMIFPSKSDDLVTTYIGKNYKGDQYDYLIRRKMLPMVSNLVRLETYNKVAQISESHYQPYTNRAIFGKSLLNFKEKQAPNHHATLNSFLDKNGKKSFLSEAAFYITIQILSEIKSKKIEKTSSFMEKLLDEINSPESAMYRIREGVWMCLMLIAEGKNDPEMGSLIMEKKEDMEAALDSLKEDLNTKLQTFTNFHWAYINPQQFGNLEFKDGRPTISKRFSSERVENIKRKNVTYYSALIINSIAKHVIGNTIRRTTGFDLFNY